jgi:hypothetical protein
MATEAKSTARLTRDSRPAFELRLHRNALIELAVFLGGAAILQLTLLEPATLASLKPHPFWIPIVLVSLQYGTIDGIAAVAACIVTQWLLGWPQLEADEEYFTYISRTLNEPVLWLGAAIVIGEFRLRQINETRELHAQLGELERQRELLAAHVADAHDRVRRLELALATSPPDRSRELVEALTSLHRCELRGPHFARTLATCAAIALDADSLSLFEMSEGALVAAVRIGSDGSFAQHARFAPGQPLHDSIVRDRAVLSVLRDQDRAALAEQGIFAAPICSSRTGQVLGMLKIEHMSPLDVTPAAEQRVVTLCHHLALALDRPAAED